MKNKIEIFDTTLRDGEQVPGCQLNIKEKIEVAKELEAMGVDVIEAGFPISSPGDFEAVSRISEEVKDATICGLTRAVKKDIEVAGEALQKANRARIHTGIGTSDSHIYDKLKSTPEEVISRGTAAVKLARQYTDDVEFYAEDAGRTSNEFLAKVVEQVIAAGATVVNIPDTTGYCMPEQYGAKIKYLMDNVPNMDQAILSTHCHNDLGLATANSIAGAVAGARQIECTVNGIGERAGNCSLEEVVMIMRQHEHLNLYTEVDAKRLNAVSNLVSTSMRMPVQPNKAIVGANAFAHSSGIHQDGVIKNRETYEIIDPKEVGVDFSSIILTARSGRAALKFRAARLGYEIQNNRIEEIYEHFLKVADEKKVVEDVDLKMIFESKMMANA